VGAPPSNHVLSGRLKQLIFPARPLGIGRRWFALRQSARDRPPKRACERANEIPIEVPLVIPGETAPGGNIDDGNLDVPCLQRFQRLHLLGGDGRPFDNDRLEILSFNPEERFRKRGRANDSPFPSTLCIEGLQGAMYRRDLLADGFLFRLQHLQTRQFPRDSLLALLHRFQRRPQVMIRAHAG
jgi:hypothetical protein